MSRARTPDLGGLLARGAIAALWVLVLYAHATGRGA